MNIVLMITGLSMGGAETQVCSIADKLYELGNDVTLIYLNGNKEVVPVNKGVEVIALNMKKTPLGLLSALIKCRNILLTIKPDVLHSHMVHANIVSRLLRLTLPIPVVISTAHNANEGGKLRMLAYRFTNSLADVSTNVSEEALQSFINKKAMRSEKSTVIYNGIDTDKFVHNEESRLLIREQLNLTHNDFLFLSIGRLTEQKDYPNLLNAFSVIKENNLNVKLAIIGKGELEHELKKLVEKLCLTEDVYFLGARNDIYELMSACDCFVLSSKYEGFGLVVAEAMSCEKVVIGTDCGGVKEVIGNEGFLVKPENHIALAKAMQEAMELNQNQRQLMGYKARQRIINNYSLDNTVSKWLELYKDPKRV
ncbi:glycosyltransferase [Psychrobacter sanguinis]|uniref:glycosyltransferase n=1 Tax=Psychrobacter sanguinis TaxID=861445 RepID=UPI002A76296C|nr:glycosyltransferase [Psychrobacter sanguinis]MDY3306098.1 glycosyltransferase [Psychrobacter sanguinis]